ncbi:MAG TPA: 7-cyano-7-deazaguanine synthase QueC [Thermoplasmatales archaeon]|nr:7-cyano-7-deazaguanine synthase QueC [Candidatus Thermoplasmatota archaeon]HDS59523.1 7-cyano-7-deazaguanine synthase QueC [Thermoplasmatales archaeon]
MKAVCLLSGGLDSCVTAAMAKKEGYELYALTVNYGQRNRREISSAKRVAAALGAREHKVIDADLRVFGQSALTDDIEVPEEAAPGIPPTYVPARNTIFLSFALAYAEAVDADAIFIGVNAVDYSGYPDCRPEFIRAFQRVAILGTKRGVDGNPIRIKTPVIDMSKEQIVARGAELGAPLEHTWSCYREGETACGRCASCRLRHRGFEKAGVTDPLPYES